MASSTTTKVAKSVESLPQRIHFKQFIAMHPELDDMQKAGFRAFCEGKDWMYESEWKKKLDEVYGKNEK